MFKKKLKDELDKLSPSDDAKRATADIIERGGVKKRPVGVISAVAAVCAVAVLCTCIAVNSISSNPPDVSAPQSSGVTYKDIYDRLSFSGSYSIKTFAAEKGAVISDGFAAGGTNIQVDGVDEEDIVKTDGEYIYRLQEEGNGINIYSADSDKTKLLSQIKIKSFFQGQFPDTSADDFSCAAVGMYLYGSRLAVVCDTFAYLIGQTSKSYAYVLIYNVSNPTLPELEKSFRQSGYFDTSRLIDGVLYISSGFHVSPYKVKYKNFKEYLPCFDDGDGEYLVEEKNIDIAEDKTTRKKTEKAADREYGYHFANSHLVISAIDINELVRTDAKTIFGNARISYVSNDSIYLTAEKYHSGYSFDVKKTEIVKYSIAGKSLEKQATGSVPGEMLNQFSLDEYEGNLRVVTTEYNKRGISSNNLIILDGDLNKLSEIRDIAEDETVYSVRFIGDVGYFVTFKQVDPLFCVDLSNPSSPKILSALKIPGFSEYLHPYSDSRLLGVGKRATNSGNVLGMKLSMFDITTPANITEKYTFNIDGDYSESSYNHKAVLVVPSRNIIAIPVDDNYQVFGYDDENGFSLRKKVRLGDDYYYSSWRGTLIDDYIYVSADDKMTVLSADSFDIVKEV